MNPTSAPVSDHVAEAGKDPYTLDRPREKLRLDIVTGFGCMLIVLSPFVAFTVNGRVDDSNWLPAVAASALGIVWIVLEDIRYRKKVPREVREQCKLGKLFQPLAKPPAALNSVTYHCMRNDVAPVRLDQDGVYISALAHLKSSWTLPRDESAAGRVSSPLTFIMNIDWAELEEWQVIDNDSTVGWYYLVYRNGNFTKLRRPPVTRSERDIFDYVRSVGQCPVRIFSDAR